MKAKLKTCAYCQLEKPVFKNETINGVRLQFCSHQHYLLAKGQIERAAEKMFKKADLTITFSKSKRKPIKKLSDKQKKVTAQYLKLRLDYLNEHKFCEFNFPGCTSSATDIHHTKGRSSNTLNINTFKAACRNCHDYGHFRNPTEAKQHGF